MTAMARFKLNSPDVASEAFDDEVVIVNLQSGHYFSTRGTGAFVWQRLISGGSAAEIQAAMAMAYDADPAQLEDSVQAFVAELVERRLIVPAESEQVPAAGPAQDPAPTAAKLAFSPPSLETYSDMQDILLLDPIHEVDDTGWPHPR